MISFPSMLPLPSINYSYANSNNTIQNKFESGRISQRKRFSGNRRKINVTFKFNQDQLGIFESFVVNVLDSGVNKFEINLPSEIEKTNTKQIVIIDKGLYEVNALAGSLVWEVSCVLIKQKVKTFSEGTLTYFETFWPIESGISFSNLLYQTVNQTIPSDFNNT